MILNASSYVYILRHPDTYEIRYVGWTSTTLEVRLKRHYKDTKTRTHRVKWIRSLRPNKPIVELIHTVLPGEDTALAERYFIAFFRAQGCRLVNSTDGGEGTVGYTHTPEQRKKISEATSGARNYCYGKPAHNRGVKTSDEVRLKQRLAKLGKTQTDEHRKKVSNALKGKAKTLEHNAKVGAALRNKPQTPAAIETRIKARQASHLNKISDDKWLLSNRTASGYRGVSWNIVYNKWEAYFSFLGVNYRLGMFADVEAAALAVRNKRDQTLQERGKFQKLVLDLAAEK